MSVQGSQASPTPSESKSAWPVFAVNGQLSVESGTVSLSSSASQTSPSVSPSKFSWKELTAIGQLSQSVPTKSRSSSAWSGLEIVGQLSVTSSTPSLSKSPVLAAHADAAKTSPSSVLAATGPSPQEFSPLTR